MDMIREQRLMMELVNILGDNFDEYILTFDSCNLWDFKEKEVIINKTFKDIVEIFANYNLTTAKDILANAYELGPRSILIGIFYFMREDYLKKGSESLLNRILIFCYTLHEYSKANNVKPTELLKEICKEDLYVIKPNFITKIKYKLGKARYPFDVIVGDYKIVLLSLITGQSFNETIYNILTLQGPEQLN